MREARCQAIFLTILTECPDVLFSSVCSVWFHFGKQVVKALLESHQLFPDCLELLDGVIALVNAVAVVAYLCLRCVQFQAFFLHQIQTEGNQLLQ